MTIEHFNGLSDDRKKELIFDAKKVAERADEITKFELFQIDSFFIEVKTSLQQRIKRIITTFSLKDIPLIYAGKVRALLTTISYWLVLGFE